MICCHCQSQEEKTMVCCYSTSLSGLILQSSWDAVQSPLSPSSIGLSKCLKQQGSRQMFRLIITEIWTECQFLCIQGEPATNSQALYVLPGYLPLWQQSSLLLSPKLLKERLVSYNFSHYYCIAYTKEHSQQSWDCIRGFGEKPRDLTIKEKVKGDHWDSTS